MMNTLEDRYRTVDGTDGTYWMPHVPMDRPDRTRVRAGLWLVAAVVLLGAGMVIQYA